ncbi:MAG: LamG domain-containing protein [Chitinophagaceae bacterium]|nr:LamG domain-containing protein [Chitinophagaceae bacterium]MCW5928600.1 LamG domain-containing protein [Chitinophagaceae bacterium]
MLKPFLLTASLFIVFIVCYGCKKTEKCGDKDHDTLKTGLIAYYPFNGNTNDESGNNNHGTALRSGLTSDKAGAANKAFNFDGSNYIKVPNSVSLSSIKETISITAWVYNTDQLVSIVCKAENEGLAMHFRLFSDSQILFANSGSAADFPVTLNPVNNWKHIAIVSDGMSVKYYLNGAIHSTLPTYSDGYTTDTSTDMYIGSDTHGFIENHRGVLDEIRIYNRLLTGEEVKEIYNM